MNFGCVLYLQDVNNQYAESEHAANTITQIRQDEITEVVSSSPLHSGMLHNLISNTFPRTFPRLIVVFCIFLSYHEYTYRITK